MPALARILLGFLGVIVLVIAAGLFWIFFYSGDLPDMNALAQFAPSSVARVWGSLPPHGDGRNSLRFDRR